MSTLHKEAQGKQLRLRIRIENITITLLAVFSLFLFILTFSHFQKYRRPCRSLLKWAEWFSVHSQLSFCPFPAVMEEETKRMVCCHVYLCLEFLKRIDRYGTSDAQCPYVV